MVNYASSADTLQQIKWRVWRAREQLETFDSLVESTLKDNFYSVLYQQNRNKRLTIRIDKVKPFPANCILLIGEISHNLRSALDHIAFSLSCPITESEEKNVKFPICSSPNEFKRRHINALKGASKKAISCFEKVQPYHRRKWPDTKFLGQLQAINNWDKHRSFSIVGASAATATVDIEITGHTSIVKQKAFRGRIEPNKIIVRLLPGESAVGAKIKCVPNLGIYPIFDNRMPKEIRNTGVRGILSGAGRFIQEELIPIFEPFF